MTHSSKTQTECAIIFVRAPKSGKVKTRLSESLGQETVLRLYRSFVRDTIETVKEQTENIRISYYPENEEKAVSDWLGADFYYTPQQGRNLGDRMRNALAIAFSDGFHRAILLGTDLPDLPGEVIAEAFSKLFDHPSVIGPAVDGGYYLIGFQQRAFLPHVFDNIPWGSRHVFRNTLSLFSKSKQDIHLLPTWQDIDDYDDLMRLITRLEKGESAAYHTRSVLTSIPLK